MEEDLMDVSIYGAQEPTLLGPVNEVYRSQDFIEPKEPVNEGEIIIGELIPYERAMWTVLTQMDLAIREMMSQGAKITHVLGSTVRTPLGRKVCNADALRRFFFAMVKDGRSGKIDDYPGKNVGIRTGWKVVVFEEADRGSACGCN